MEKYISDLKGIEQIIESSKSRFSSFSSTNVPSSKSLEAEFLELQNDKRLLKIGIVGRVKAGKSSLLNALVFGGENILPKAATPMTAALTKLEYSDKFAFQADFFDKEDIEKIKEAAKQYQSDFAKNLAIEKEELAKKNARLTPQEVEERAKRTVSSKMKDSQNAVSFDQAARMLKSGINIQELDSNKVHECASLEDFKVKLGDYVGSDGKFMPFTKSVTLKMPFEALKDVEIVDTPGLNDPVESRSKRTTDMLSQCDVVLIVSPAGQFMSSEDVNLMANSITKKGINELYIIASQADVEFHGDLKAKFKSADAVLTQLEKILAGSLNQALSGEDLAIFGSLTKESAKRLICSSGIAVNIKKNLDDLAKLDSSEAHALKLLQKNYPSDFPANNNATLASNLDKISNISRVQNILNEVRTNKDKIKGEAIQSTIAAHASSVKTYKNELVKFLNDSKNELLSTNMDSLKSEQVMLQKIKTRGSEVLDVEFESVTDEFAANLKNALQTELKAFFKAARNETKDAEGSRTESYEVSTSKWYKPWSWGSSRTEYRTYTTARTNQVKTALYDLERNLQDALDEIYSDKLQEFKKDVANKKLLPPLRAEIQKAGGDDELIDPLKWRRITTGVVNQMPQPSLTCRCSVPSGSGTLEGWEAERFLEEAIEAVNSLEIQVGNEIKNICQEIKSVAQGFNIGERIFGEFNAKISQLANDLNNKQQTLDEFDSLISKLQKVGE